MESTDNQVNQQVCMGVTIWKEDNYISIAGRCNVFSFCGVRAGSNAQPVQCCPDIYEGPASLVFDGHQRRIPRGLSSPDMKPNFYLLLVPKLRIVRTIRPRPQVCLHNVHRDKFAFILISLQMYMLLENGKPEIVCSSLDIHDTEYFLK